MPDLGHIATADPSRGGQGLEYSGILPNMNPHFLCLTLLSSALEVPPFIPLNSLLLQLQTF